MNIKLFFIIFVVCFSGCLQTGGVNKGREVEEFVAEKKMTEENKPIPFEDLKEVNKDIFLKKEVKVPLISSESVKIYNNAYVIVELVSIKERKKIIANINEITKSVREILKEIDCGNKLEIYKNISLLPQSETKPLSASTIENKAITTTKEEALSQISIKEDNARDNFTNNPIFSFIKANQHLILVVVVFSVVLLVFLRRRRLIKKKEDSFCEKEDKMIDEIPFSGGWDIRCKSNT